MYEIKVRAWDKGRKEMCPVRALTELAVMPAHDAAVGKAIILRDGLLREPLEFGKEDSPLILMPFSEQLDKNDKRVAAGDIVDFEYGLGVVFWDELTSCFKIKFDTDGDDLWLYCPNVNSRLEIIGNIWENHGLLEEE